MTGKPLELYLLTYNGDIYKGKNNYLGIVKKIKIGQSASKHLDTEMKVQRLVSPFLEMAYPKVWGNGRYYYLIIIKI